MSIPLNNNAKEALSKVLEIEAQNSELYVQSKKIIQDNLAKCSTAKEKLIILKKELEIAYELKKYVNEEIDKNNTVADRVNAIFTSDLAADQLIKYVELEIAQNQKIFELESLTIKNKKKDNLSGIYNRIEDVFKDKNEAKKIIVLLKSKGIIDKDEKWIGLGKNKTEVIALIEALDELQYLLPVKKIPRGLVFCKHFGINIYERNFNNNAPKKDLEKYIDIIPSREKLSNFSIK